MWQIIVFQNGLPRVRLLAGPRLGGGRLRAHLRAGGLQSDIRPIGHSGMCINCSYIPLK